MADEISPSASQGSSVTKPSFFKKKNISRSPANDSNSDVFSRSTSLFHEIVAEKQRKRKDKFVQRNQRPVSPAIQSSKKRRVSETIEAGSSTHEGIEYDNL